MSAAYKVLLTRDLLVQICDHHVELILGPMWFRSTLHRLSQYAKHGRNAAIFRHIDLVDSESAQNIMIQAARGDNVSMIKYLSEKYSEDSKSTAIKWADIFDAAAMCGSLNVLAWLEKEKNAQIAKHSQDISWIAGNGDIATLQWLYDHIGPSRMIGDPLTRATKSGHVEVLEWLTSNKLMNIATNATHCMLIAIKYGRIDIVKWICKKINITVSTAIVAFAASYGQVDIIDTLYSNKKFIDNSVDFAAPSAAVSAANYNHENTIEWLYKNRGSDIDICMSCAAKVADMRNFKTLAKKLWDLTSPEERSCNAHISDVISLPGSSHISLLQHRTRRLNPY